MEALTYDNSTSSDTTSMIDVTYSMGNMTGDTAGGFWTESASSWLHISADGATAHRFNLTGSQPGNVVNAIAAVSPTELVVSHGAVGPDQALSRFHVDEQSWEPIAAEGDWIGDVAVVAGSIYYVRYTAPPVVPTSFTVERIDPNGEQSTRTPANETFIAESAAIAADLDGTLYVVTESERFVLDPQGTVLSRSEIATERPIVALSPNGTPLWSGADTPTGEPWHIVSGSDEAKAIIAKHSECTDGGLTIGPDADAADVPFLCEASAAVWLNDSSFVIAAGNETGTVLARAQIKR